MKFIKKRFKLLHEALSAIGPTRTSEAFFEHYVFSELLVSWSNLEHDYLLQVVESTIYPVSDISYPAVTICNNNRVNWDRVEPYINESLQNASAVTKKHFRAFLHTLNTLEYGSFDEFVGIKDWNVTEMNHINLLEMYEKITFTCDEMFDSGYCWFRNKYYNCCELFSPHKTEYGLCLAFNSVINDVGYRRLVRADGWLF